MTRRSQKQKPKENAVRRWLFGVEEGSGLFGADGYMHPERYDPERTLSEYHNRLKRQHAAREARRQLYRLRYRLRYLPEELQQVKDDPLSLLPFSLRRRLMEREIAQTRKLTYSSYYVLEEGEQREVEGYLRLESGLYSLEILTPCALEETARHMGWARGAVVGLEYDYRHSILVPGDRLDEELIREAIGRWYMERVEWKHRHWAVRAGALPEIELDLHWEKPSTDRLSPADFDDFSRPERERRFSRFAHKQHGEPIYQAPTATVTPSEHAPEARSEE